MRWFILLFCLVAQTALAVDQKFFDESLGDFSEEMTLAREQGKKGILLFFEMDECPFCHRMKTTILNQPEVIAYFKKHFLIYSVDIEGDVEINDFQGNAITQKDFAFKEHRVRATPVIAFFDLNGQRVARYTGATSTIEEFMWLGEFVVTEAYKTTSFNRFKQEKRKTSG